MPIIYPPESFSVEIHILIMVVATIVTLVGLILGAMIKRGKAGGIAAPWDVILKDIIPVGGIILALLGPVIAGIFNPVLDYDIEDFQNRTLQVKITNYGFVSAKKVDLYFNAPGINFSTFGSMPFVNGSTYSNSKKLNSEGNALYSIPVLTPRSETKITASITNNLTNTDAIVYLRSETSTGVHNVIDFTKAYVAYAVALAFSVLWVIYREWKLDKWYDWAFVIVNGVAIFLIVYFLFVGACEGRGNCLSYGIYN